MTRRVSARIAPLSHVFLLPFVSCLNGGRWARDLISKLRCGMTIDEVQYVAEEKVVALAGQGRLGTHYIRRGGTDVWLQVSDRKVVSVLSSQVDSLKTTRLSPRTNLCTGEVSFLVRLKLPAGFETARIYIDGI